MNKEGLFNVQGLVELFIGAIVGWKHEMWMEEKFIQLVHNVTKTSKLRALWFILLNLASQESALDYYWFI